MLVTAIVVWFAISVVDSTNAPYLVVVSVSPLLLRFASHILLVVVILAAVVITFTNTVIYYGSLFLNWLVVPRSLFLQPYITVTSAAAVPLLSLSVWSLLLLSLLVLSLNCSVGAAPDVATSIINIAGLILLNPCCWLL